MIGLKFVVFLFSATVLSQHLNALEVQFDQIELLNSSFIEGAYNVSVLRIAKFNRTAYGLNFVGEFYEDFTNKHSFEVFFYYNRLNNNQYNKSPARIPKQSFCSIGERYYKQNLMHQLKDVSNLPQFDRNTKFCPFPKGSYWVKNFILKEDKLPQSARSGNYIVEFIMYRGREVLMVVKLYVRVTGSMYARF